MNINEYTTEELLFEIARRKREEEIPKPISNPDYSFLKTVCSDYLREVLNGERETDTKHYIFEEAMKAVFGKKIFDWINKQS